MQLRASIMVGRDDEFQTLENALKDARDGRGGAVFVVGEGGIGKSRLALAAADLGSAAGMSILRGRGKSVAPMVPFWLLTQALMSLLRAGAPIDVDRLGPYRPILARLVPDLGPPAGWENDTSLAVLAEAVLRLTALAGEERGCLLVLDDLQDSDAETLAVVEYLADNLHEQPVVLLGTVRCDPGPALDLARSAAQRGSGVLVELRRLDAEDVRCLAGSCLGIPPGQLPGRLAEHLWTGSAGIPLLAEELLGGMVHDRLLVHTSEGWRVTGPLRTTVPVTLTRAMAGQLDRAGARERELLSVAAVLGRRFPLAVLHAATAMSDRSLHRLLRAEFTAQLIAPDEEAPDWYAFRHPLIVDVLLSLLTPDQRIQLSARAADAVEAVYPGLPGEWCQSCADLRMQAGQESRAGRLFAEAGSRALAQGAANSAVTLLDKALELLTGDDDAQIRADAFASLLYALAEAGLVERALSSANELEHLAGLLSRCSRARLHTRLAWAAVIAGRHADGMAQVDIARRLVGPEASDQENAPIDVVAAHLLLDLPGPDQRQAAEALARRAASVAETARLPDVACQAWQLLGALSRSWDPDEATACLERARQIAVQHHLRIEEIHALIRLGTDDMLRDGSIDRLEYASQEASQAGAVSARYMAEATIALQGVLRGDFAVAERLLDQVLTSTMRLRLLETTQYALLVKAVLGAHRGRRCDMDAALAELCRWKGDHVQNIPRVHGLARAWCALLEENRPRALRELSIALAAEEQSPSIFQLTGRYGLHLLLRVLDGTWDWADYRAVTAAPVSKLRWDRQFALFAEAVLAGRSGQPAQAAEAMAEATRIAAPYAMARHMGLRLVSEAATGDSWGSPVTWLRAAEEYFHAAQVPAVAGACRALMRRSGVSVGQHRRGHLDIPSHLRTVGITVREYEILQLLIDRLSNREIAARLHLSPRTVEKHVASLSAKTGQRSRLALREFGAAALR
jgi:DNA-binding CsgD family transcriptional regulator